MSTRAASRLAWSLAGLSVALLIASVPLFVLARSANVPSSWGADLSFGGLLGRGLFLVFPLVGVLIASRRPKNPIGWLWPHGRSLVDPQRHARLLQRLRYGPARLCSLCGAGWGSNNWLWVPAVGLLGTYLFLLFPDGRLPSRSWRPLARLSGVVLVLTSAAIALKPRSIPGLGGMRNPFGLDGAPE
jgi:hypothetical protein